MIVWQMNRSFVFMWSGRLISRIGDAFYSIALAWWILERTHSSAMLGMMLAAAALPELMIGPISGVYVDRWNRKTIMVVSDLLRGFLFVAMAGLAALHRLTIGEVFATTIVVSLLSAFFNSSSMAIIPQVVDRDDIPRANSLMKLTGGISTITGPLLGAACVKLFGFSVVFGLNGLTFIVASVLAVFLTVRAHTSIQTRVLRSIKESFRFILDTQLVRRVLLIIALVHVFFGGLEVALPVFSNEAGGGGIQYLAYLQVSLGIGMVGSAAILQRSKPRHVRGPLLYTAIAGLGLLFLSFGAFAHWGVKVESPYLLIAFLIGACVTVASVLWQSLLHLSIPAELSGRIFSITSTLADTSLPVSMLLFGLLMRSFAPSTLMLVSGLMMTILGLVFIMGTRHRSKLDFGDGAETMVHVDSYRRTIDGLKDP